jgi:RND family efflux transporter MFP subunit
MNHAEEPAVNTRCDPTPRPPPQERGRSRVGHALLRFCWLLAFFAPVAGWSAEIAGVTEPFLDATLTTPVAGILAKHFFHEGDFVTEGQVIVQLDNRLEELEVARRQVVVDNTTAVLKRTEQLAATSKAVAAEDLDKQRADQKIAQAELEFAREQLRRREIRAPFSGVVADLFDLDDGEGCQPQTPLVRLVDTRRCWFVANIEARYVQRHRVGEKLGLHLEQAGGPRTVEGELRFISPVADPASGLVKIKALFDNSELKIAAGAGARLELPESP